MIDLLTIVIPTRDRPDFLALCLRSVFERQKARPTVIVSDNSRPGSTSAEPLIGRYPLSYVRQSGTVRMIDHHNTCLKMARTPWVLLLHDDDELYPDALERLEPFIAGAGREGALICGTELIDERGTPFKSWIPETAGSFKGEEVVRQIGLDFQVSPPGFMLSVEACKSVGGFPEVNGMSADYTLLLQLANSYGVAFSREILGRYRIGQQQTANYSTPARAELNVNLSIGMSLLTRNIGISAQTSDQLIDYLTWWTFYMCAMSQVKEHPFFVARLSRRCERVTPPNGAWRQRVRQEYPFLFRRPMWLWVSLYRLMERVRQTLPPKALAALRRAVGK